ncbi:MAG: CPBP family intramembrane glutamic endopeptidase [Usitatibacter sp.]
MTSIIAIFGTLVVMTLVAKPHEFIVSLGFTPARIGGPLVWLLAILVTIYYVWGVAHIPAVRERMFRPTLLKLVAVIAAVMAGIVEEVIFRKWVMDYLDRAGMGMTLQVLASGVAFGLAHATWGLMARSFGAALHAIVSTGLLGIALGVIYLAADRSLAPCIIAHFFMTALAEPGLMVAGLQGELGFRAKRA